MSGATPRETPGASELDRELDTLRAENRRLRRTGEVLTDRVEHGSASEDSASFHFDQKAQLEKLVEDRTRDLIVAKARAEAHATEIEHAREVIGVRSSRT